MLFHICGKFVQYHRLFSEFFTRGVLSCGGLADSISRDFQSDVAILEMQVLGLIGKLLTGPWMTRFTLVRRASHLDGIEMVKDIVTSLKLAASNRQNILTQMKDFFGRELDETDVTLAALRAQPVDIALFYNLMISACLLAIVTVLERQYQRYFSMELSEELVKETQSARMHNIDAEEIMGMFGAGKERAKNANVDFLAARLRSRKNKVVQWLDDMYEDKRSSIVNWAIGEQGKGGN